LERINVMGGGSLNGRLSPTYAVLARHGVRQKSIAAAVRSAEALGVLKVKRGGYDRKTKRMGQNIYRLTYIPAWNAAAPTDDWRSWEPGPRAWTAALKAARAAAKSAPRAFAAKKPPKAPKTGTPCAESNTYGGTPYVDSVAENRP
jgi:hypothetical protein